MIFMDNSAILSYILRDHDSCKLESKKSTLQLVEKLKENDTYMYKDVYNQYKGAVE